jgi:hypothetical protein
MRRSVTMRFDEDVLDAARGKAMNDNRTLTNYVETLVRKDLHLKGAESQIELIAPKNIRKSTAIPLPGETASERKRRNELFLAVVDASHL